MRHQRLLIIDCVGGTPIRDVGSVIDPRASGGCRDEAGATITRRRHPSKEHRYLSAAAGHPHVAMPSVHTPHPRAPLDPAAPVTASQGPMVCQVGAEEWWGDKEWGDKEWSGPVLDFNMNTQGNTPQPPTEGNTIEKRRRHRFQIRLAWHNHVIVPSPFAPSKPQITSVEAILKMHRRAHGGRWPSALSYFLPRWRAKKIWHLIMWQAKKST